MGKIDEADLLLLMNSKYDNIFRFDSENQQMVTDEAVLPPELEPFVDSNGVFQCTEYCLTFTKEIHRVIAEGSMPLPPGRTILTNIIHHTIRRFFRKKLL